MTVIPFFAASNFRMRCLSALTLGPLVVGAVFAGGIAYWAMVVAAMALGYGEWLRMTKGLPWRILGAAYLLTSGLALIGLRGLPEHGLAWTLYLLSAVWATDIGAYAAGRCLGGPKLCPLVSPNKTWAGLLGGMALAAGTGYGVAVGFSAAHPQTAALLAPVLAAVAQLGDLFESWIKRQAGVKDSGTLIPGHGGVLDRIDGLIAASLLLGALQMSRAPATAFW